MVMYYTYVGLFTGWPLTG